MKTPILKTLTRILTLCALSASALNVLAENKVVTTGTVTESNQTYEAVSGTAALYVRNPGASYLGTNITLSSTSDSVNGRYAAQVNNQGSLSLTGGTVTTTGTRGHGVFFSGTAVGALTGVTITTSGYNAIGVSMDSAATGTIDRVNITTHGDMAYGWRLTGTDTQLVAQDVVIVTYGTSSSGLSVATGASFHGESIAITTYGDSTRGLALSSTSTINHLQITSHGDYAHGFTVNGDLIGGVLLAEVSISDAQIQTDGYSAHGFTLGNNGAATLRLTDATVTASGANSNGIYFSSTGTDAMLIAELTRVTITAPNSAISAGTGKIGTTISSADDIRTGTYAVILRDSTVSGGVNLIDLSSVLSGSNAAGEMVPYDVPVNLTVSAEHSTLTGDILASGTATAELTVNLTDSSTLTGNLTANDNAVVDLTVSGTGSTILGDITQSGSSAVTVIIDNSATGQGGYHGGNLITGADSVWTFDKDSHGNYGENNGTWNIGDYEVIFDNMIHTGTVNLNVNSDTGEGGSITVTGTADGDGTVHIDTTGDGQADPNQVLPGIVSGEGTEHWQWDPIDWGIDTIIKDGDHFIKQGTSPAGAVLNSSMAIQQAMWFAQQNSLLKRMGELRYGARASRPLADKDVRVPYHSLIENIWLRSYGQQLNVGSQVAGKAYEQLIYGVDLGTDHKFTISADSDLYLGVYAGYGRSDIDYRTPGADGEINSYYGGLYATWLHSSGFYIDATVKAASINNDLKAPYGTTQLTANYSDVNIGGSIELGKKFTFSDTWFIEPQFQVNYLHILAEDYTAGPMTISAQDLDALQFRIGSLFGRTINLTNSGALQPYIKVSGVETISSGGAIRNGYQHTRANTDGARAELGAGLIWQLDTNNQLHLDYEASFGDKYDKPWGLTAGYRHQF